MATYSLTPSADSYIASGQGNLGSSQGLVAGQVFVISTLFSRALLRFDLTALAGLAIVSATLRLSLSEAFFPEGPHVISLHETSTTWTELGVTWTSADGATNWTTAGGDYGAAFTTGTVTHGATSLTFNMLQKVQQRAGGLLNTIAVSPEDGAINHFFTAYSKESGDSSLWPTLTVVAVTPAGAPLQWNAPGSPCHWAEPAVELPPLEWSPLASKRMHWTA